MNEQSTPVLVCLFIPIVSYFPCWRLLLLLLLLLDDVDTANIKTEEREKKIMFQHTLSAVLCWTLIYAENALYCVHAKQHYRVMLTYLSYCNATVKFIIDNTV